MTDRSTPEFASASPGQPPPAAPLGEATAHGFAYFLIQSLSAKGINVIGLIVLSWLLGNADFGYVGIAYAVATFASLIQHGGLREMLIQRGAQFERWANAGVWMSLAQGLTSTLLLVIAAPVAVELFHRDTRLFGLILVLALQYLPSSLCTVPEAKLQIALRFKFLAAVAFLSTSSMMVLSITLAALGFGPYSFVVPWPVVAVIRLLILWPTAGIKVRWNPEFQRMWQLLTDNLILLAAAFFWTITWYGDYLILGRLLPQKELVGHYYWAFNMSSQTLQLVALNMAGVLMAPLSRLQFEPVRQLGAFLRAGRALMVVGVPACLLQAALADPLVRLIFDPKWYAAIPLIQILSVGWIFLVAAPPSSSLLKARGLFSTQLRLQAVLATIFVAFVYTGTTVAGTVGAASALACYALIAGPLSLRTSTRTLGGTWRDVLGVFIVPVLVGPATIGGAWALTANLVDTSYQRWIQLFAVPIIGGGLYLMLIRYFAAASWNEIVSRARTFLLVRRDTPGQTAPDTVEDNLVSRDVIVTEKP